MNRATIAATLVIVMCSLAPTVRADAPSRLSTDGIGEVVVKPSRVTLVTSVQGSGQLASDAVVKFRDAKRRGIETFQQLAIPNLTVEGQGMAIHTAYDQNTINMLQQRMWNPELAATEIDTKPQIVAKESLKVVITGIDKLSEEELVQTLTKLIEAMGDAGLPLGWMDPTLMLNYGYGNQPMSIFVFESDHTEKAEAEARAKAIEKARARATDMASQTGVTLGPIVSVREDSAGIAGHNPYQNPLQALQMSGVLSLDNQGGASTAADGIGGAKVRIRVFLEFAIEPAPAP